jgi:nickel-dependent lactate racemase
MIPALLEELDGIIDLDDVVVLVATGTHRANTDTELRAMFGDAVVDAVRIVNHDARARDTVTWCGRFGADVPVWLHREWCAADVRITTGFVEPHFFAGFSGGPKLVAPGLAALETVLVLHDAARIGHPNARWGVTTGNPVHDDVRAIAAATGVTFALDVVLDANKAIVDAFGGDLEAEHTAACASARTAAMQPSTDRSTSSSRPAPATRSTRTSTRPSRGCPRRTRSSAPAGRSSVLPNAATDSPTTARTGPN